MEADQRFLRFMWQETVQLFCLKDGVHDRHYLQLSCATPSGSVKFSMLNSGTYTVKINGVRTQSQTATLQPNRTLQFST
jgi:hypothetical protein